MAQIKHSYILQWSKKVTPKVIHLAFKREDGEPIPFKAGQFITLHIQSSQDPAKTLHRSYSIANIPGKDNLLEIACSYVEGGVATNLLFNLKPGDTIAASGPYGLFVLKDESPERYVLIATGTGVTPYRSMLDEIQQRLIERPSLNALVLLGVRNPDELLFGEDFIRLANQQNNFKFKACYSREVEKELETFEQRGHVQDLFPSLALDPLKDLVYLCGNPNMIDDAFLTLANMGFDKKNVRREKYSFAH